MASTLIVHTLHKVVILFWIRLKKGFYLAEFWW